MTSRKTTISATTCNMHNSQPPSRVGWVLTGDYTFASSRLQGYRIHDYLIEQGHSSLIIADSFGPHDKNYSSHFFTTLRRILKSRCNVIMFQKPGWMMFKLSEILRLRGIKTIAIQCDPFPGDYGRYFDATIVTSEELKQQIAVPTAHVIDDMLEVPAETYKHNYATQTDRLRVVWVGQGTGPAGKMFIQPFTQQLAQHPLLAGRTEIITISRGEWASHQWSLDTVYDQLCESDVAIIPFPEHSWANAKSTNRLTMLMALGLPTVVSPIPSYQRITRPNDNCLSARTVDEFASAIEQYRDPALRASIGTAGRALALAHYAPSVIGPAWIQVIRDTLEAPRQPQTAALHTRALSALCGMTALL